MDTQEQRIELEAEKYVNDTGIIQETKWVINMNKTSYIAGATIEAARNKENAVALLNWMAINNYREVGVDSETGAYFAKFQGRVCCSDYFKPEQLYYLFINEQNKKV